MSVTWQDPPALERCTNCTTPGVKGGYSNVPGLSNAKLGYLVEKALAKHLGFELAHPSRPQGPFDLLKGDNAYEVKAMTVGAREYKVKSSKVAIERKRKHAKLHRLKPHTIIAVVDATATMAYAYVRPGVGAFRLPNTMVRGWKYLGAVPLEAV